MIKPANCTRLFADEHGETHFEDIEFPMHDVQYAPPAPALQLSDPIAARRLSWLRFPADWTDAAHPSPRRQLFVVLAGEVEGRTSRGDRRHFRPGDCLLMEDTVGRGHGAKPLNGEALAIMVALE
jgi:hypothetical protein